MGNHKTRRWEKGSFGEASFLATLLLEVWAETPHIWKIWLHLWWWNTFIDRLNTLTELPAPPFRWSSFLITCVFIEMVTWLPFSGKWHQAVRLNPTNECFRGRHCEKKIKWKKFWNINSLLILFRWFTRLKNEEQIQIDLQISIKKNMEVW